MSLSFDTRALDAMLERIETRARTAWADEVMAVAEEGAAQVSNITDPELAASVHGTLGRRRMAGCASCPDLASDNPVCRALVSCSGSEHAHRQKFHLLLPSQPTFTWPLRRLRPRITVKWQLRQRGTYWLNQLGDLSALFGR